MKLKFKNISVVLASSLMAVSVTSCQDFADGFLSQGNPNELSTDVFWEDLDDCNAGLTTVYKQFQSQNIMLLVSESSRSDMVWPGVWPKFPDTTNEYFLHTFTSTSTDVGNRWAALYTGIFRANQVIAGLEALESEYIDDEDSYKEWQLIMGQARFFRGLFHFYLNLSYNEGNVPIMSFVPKDESEFFQTSSPSDEVKAFAREDLLYAESVLPIKGAAAGSDREDWQLADGNVGRVTSGAASTMLGISYLYDGEYDKAQEFFATVVNNASYRLADISENFTTNGEFNDESILEINYTHTYNSEYDTWDSRLLSNYLHLQIAPGSYGGWGPTIFPQWWLMRNYVYENVDKRDSRNIVYLTTDSHGDILYRDMMLSTTSTSNGKTYKSYPVLADSNMVYYTKRIEVDSSGNPVIANKEDLPEDTYTELAVSMDVGDVYENKEFSTYNNNLPEGETAKKLGRVKAFKATLEDFDDMTWDVYYDENGLPYRYRNHSLRASHSIIMPSEMDLSYYGDPVTMQTWGYSNAISAFRKYTNWDVFTTENNSPKIGYSDINVRVLRLADVYLMYAECLIKGGTDGGGVSEALRYINRVRQRAGITLIGSETDPMAEYYGSATYQNTPDLESGEVASSFYGNKGEAVISSAQEVMDHLMYRERPLELSLEGYGIRYYDLRRWGIVKERFQSLQTQTFATWALPYISTKTGSTATMWSWAFSPTDDVRAAGNTFGTETNLFTMPANNYSDAKAYFPIPDDEVVSNPNAALVVGAGE